MTQCAACTDGTVIEMARRIPCPLCFGWLYPVLVGEIKRTMEFGYYPGLVDFAQALLLADRSQQERDPGGL